MVLLIDFSISAKGERGNITERWSGISKLEIGELVEFENLQLP
jgi:hypothetical protein